MITVIIFVAIILIIIIGVVSAIIVVVRLIIANLDIEVHRALVSAIFDAADVVNSSFQQWNSKCRSY